MRVHVADLVAADAGIGNRLFHHAEAAFVLGSRLGDVIRIAAHPITDDLRKDSCAALLRAF